MDSNFKPKSFWKRPEGVTGAIFLIGALIGAGLLLPSIISFIVGALTNVLQLSILIIALAAVVYMVLDPKSEDSYHMRTKV